MIFIGPELSDAGAHFVTNIVSSIGGDTDLVIDLLNIRNKVDIYKLIQLHLNSFEEHYVIYNAYQDEDFFIGFKQRFPQLQLVTVFSDDEWRHKNYDRYIALYSDVFTIAVKDNVEKYESYDLKPYYMRWACNPDMFYPLAGRPKNIDVSFIGAAYGLRVDYIRFLIANNINVRVYGQGWDRFSDIRSNWGGYLTHDEMLEVISSSRINLNFLWTSADAERCTIKGRTLELAACRAFQLSNYTDEFSNYGFVSDVNIGVFRNKTDLLSKIDFYLKRNDLRESVAALAYEHVLASHTWRQRFQFVDDSSNAVAAAYMPPRKFCIMIIAPPTVSHQIQLHDKRLNLQIVAPSDNWQDKARSLDGVVYLTHDSTLNNETLLMMAFGLRVDNSEVIATNFYLGPQNDNCWIRFKDLKIQAKLSLLKILPISGMMFSGEYAYKHGCDLANANSISYIEYPSFSLKLPYLQSRILRLYFAYHKNSLRKIKNLIARIKIIQAISIGMDKLWQKAL